MNKRQIFGAALRHLATDGVWIWGMVILPVMALVVYMGMMHSGLPSQIPLAVVDHDNSASSRALVRQIDAFPKSDAAARCGSFPEARKLMEQGKVYAILVIPEDFAAQAATQKQPQLTYYTNNAFLINGSLLFQDLKTASTLAAASVGLGISQAKGVTGEKALQMAQPIAVESHPIGNPTINYSVYLNNMLLPGTLQLIVIVFTIATLGACIKTGMGRRLADGNPLGVLSALLAPASIVFAAVSLLYISALYYYAGFPLGNGFWPILGSYLMLVLASMGLGVAVFAVFRNYRFSVSVGCLLGVLSIPLSGFTFPATAMYGFMQAWSDILPLRQFFMTYVGQALNGYAFGYSATHYAAMGVWVAAGLLLAPRAVRIVKNDPYTP